MATFYQDAVKQIGTTEAVLHSLYKKLGRKDHIDFTEELVSTNGGTKKELSSFLFKFVNCSVNLIKSLKSGCLEVDSLKSEAKHAIKELAGVQSELLDSKREQIDILQSGIQTTLKNELKSYSEAVKKSTAESITLKKIKTAVKDIVEDRSKNLMIFGLEEAADEDIHSTVKEVFMSIEEKPFFKAERIGKQHSSVISRPVKVVLDSSNTLTNLLRKSKELKTTTFKNVYLTPDRTLEQRVEHRKLVAELREKAREMPNEHHFIRNGAVCSQAKSVEDTDIVSKSSAIKSSSAGVTKKKEKKPRTLLPHHIAFNRRPPPGYVSPVTTDSSDCDG